MSFSFLTKIITTLTITFLAIVIAKFFGQTLGFFNSPLFLVPAGSLYLGLITAYLKRFQYSIHFISIFEPLFAGSIFSLAITAPLYPPITLIYFLSAVAIVSGTILSIGNEPNLKITPETKIKKAHKWLLFILLSLTTFGYSYQLGNYGFQMDEFYGAREIQTYHETGRLFFLDDIYYGRSEITTLIGLTSESVTNFFKGDHLTIEFILRFPMVLLGIGSLILIFLLTQKITDPTTALVATTLVASEIYFVYFFTYFRFYAPSIFLTLLFLYIIQTYRSRKNALLLALISVGLYDWLTEYFLFTALFFLIIYLSDLWQNRHLSKKVERFSALIITLSFIILGLGIISSRANSTAVYDLISLSFNQEAMLIMFNWLLINYASFIIVGLLSIILFFIEHWQKNNWSLLNSSVLSAYLFFNLLILFGYIVHAPFNFTFRITLFFLPVLFIVSIASLQSLLTSRKFFALIATTLVFVNIYNLAQFSIHKTGDAYHPLRPVYEKNDMATGDRDIANFLNQTIPITQSTTTTIGYIGLGYDHLRYYLRPDLRNRILGDFRYRKVGNSTLDDLEYFIDTNSDKYTFIVIASNALKERENFLYQKLWQRNNITEVDSSLVERITGDYTFKKVFTADDGYTSVYLKVEKTS